MTAKTVRRRLCAFLSFLLVPALSACCARASGPGPAVSCGDSHTTLLAGDGSVWSSGYNSRGQLGDGTSEMRPAPVRVKGPGGAGWLEGIVSVSNGTRVSNVYALREDGTVWTWGGTRRLPEQVAGPGGEGGLGGIVQLAGGERRAFALGEDGTVWAWARSFGPHPEALAGPGAGDDLAGITGIASGYRHTVALREDGTVWLLWPRREQVSGPGGEGNLEGVVQVSAGNGCTFAVKADGSVWAWGANRFGQLGNGTTRESPDPVRVLGPGGEGHLSGIVSVSGNNSRESDHVLALASDGTLWAWGNNAAGQLGDGTTETRTVPVRVKSPCGTGILENIATVSSGAYHSAAIARDGTVFAWGSNWYGQFGNGEHARSTHTLPVASGPFSGKASP